MAGAFLGYPVADGVFTSGGMTSNLTALVAAREAAQPGARETGVDGAAPPSSAPRRRTTRSCARSR